MLIICCIVSILLGLAFIDAVICYNRWRDGKKDWLGMDN